ncbi:MAG: iron ABC transporter permease [Myxococcota bacterium]
MKPRAVALLILAVVLVVTVLACLGIGTSSIDLLAVFHPNRVVTGIRLPRVLLAAMAGAGLAAAGVAFQGILRNPLADPYIVGVSGGAALGGVLALVLGVSAPFALPIFAFSGAVASALLLFALARARGRSDAMTLLLVGVVFNAFAAAVVTFLKTVVSATKAQEILFWLMGVIDVQPLPTLIVLAAYIAVGSAVLLAAGGALNLLSTSDDEAAALGLPVEKARLIIFLAAALLVGSVVAVAGMIGFVGLVVPHILRRLIGADHRWLMPAALLGGAIFLVAADAVARLTFYAFGTEVPVGVVTAFTGGPFFLALLLYRDA